MTSACWYNQYSLMVVHFFLVLSSVAMQKCKLLAVSDELFKAYYFNWASYIPYCLNGSLQFTVQHLTLMCPTAVPVDPSSSCLLPGSLSLKVFLTLFLVTCFCAACTILCLVHVVLVLPWLLATPGPLFLPCLLGILLGICGTIPGSDSWLFLMPCYRSTH